MVRYSTIQWFATIPKFNLCLFMQRIMRALFNEDIHRAFSLTRYCNRFPSWCSSCKWAWKWGARLSRLVNGPAHILFCVFFYFIFLFCFLLLYHIHINCWFLQKKFILIIADLVVLNYHWFTYTKSVVINMDRREFFSKQRAFPRRIPLKKTPIVLQYIIREQKTRT